MYVEIAAAPASVARGGPGSAAVACGSAGTLSAAVHTLESGGNAVDAAVAAGFAAAVAEPTLASLGGGGFMLVREPAEAPTIADFFVDVPGLGGRCLDPHIETLAVTFGSGAEQAFHVGWGSVATPGCLAGLLDAHQRWGALTLPEILTPAIVQAHDGVRLDAVQVEFIEVIGAILHVTPQSGQLYDAPLRGDVFRNPAYARLLERLAGGDIGGATDPAIVEPVAAAMREHGGLVTAEDLQAYRPVLRTPLSTARRSATLWTNPPPSFGGSIVVDALNSLPPNSDPASLWPAAMHALRSATRDRRRLALDQGRTHVSRGTTHISVVDGHGRVAALSMSNGSGSGVMVDGVSFNNMLGEEDLNPFGLHAAPAGTRMGSMMAPTLITDADGGMLVAGTGGSERIRSALLTVFARIIDLGFEPEDAIGAPRLHAAEHLTDLEPGLPSEVVSALRNQATPLREWPGPDLFFGGVHAVRRSPDGAVVAIGDARRGGSVAVVD